MNKIDQFVQSLPEVILQYRAQQDPIFSLDQFIDKRLTAFIGFVPSLKIRDKVLNAKKEIFKNNLFN